MNSNNNLPLVISFYTNDWEYPAHANRMAKDCVKLGVDYYIQEKKSTTDYILNTAIKPFFILECFKEFKRPLLWVDVDGILLKKPHINCDADFAATEYQNLELNRDWAVSILWFNYTTNARIFLEKWCEQAADETATCRTDEAAFDIVWKKFKNNVIPFALPNQFCFNKWSNRLDIPDDTIFCNQLSQFEDKIRRKTNGQVDETI